MSSLDHLLEALEDTQPQDLKRELKELRAIKEWAIKNLGIDYAEDDRVVICSPAPASRGGGWAHYSEALAIGQTGIAASIEFDMFRRDWYVVVSMDRAWTVSKSDKGDKITRYWRGPANLTPPGFEPPSEWEQDHFPDGKVKHFYMELNWVRKADKG